MEEWLSQCLGEGVDDRAVADASMSAAKVPTSGLAEGLLTMTGVSDCARVLSSRPPLPMS